MPAAPTQLAQAVRHQIEYYLSLDNLVRDLFLRAKMDADGWIPLAIIAGFNRVRVMTSDVALIAAALLNSSIAELSPDALMVYLQPALQFVCTFSMHRGTLSSFRVAPGWSPLPKLVCALVPMLCGLVA